MLAVAEEAVRLASADAREAQRLAAGALIAADDPETRSVAERALGLAAIELGDVGVAVSHFGRAVELGDAQRAAEARMSLALALTLQGETAGALAALDAAEPALEGHLRARVQGQRAVVLQKLGRLDEALRGYRNPLRAHRRAGDRLWEARLLCNRGVLQVYRGALSAAEADFERAEELHESIGQALAATQVRHNLGWVAARLGDVPLALEWYDRVEAEYRAHGVPLALLLMDRCEVLLSARLAAEAKANADAAVAELAAAGLVADLAEARLLAAHAELLVGDTSAARDHAVHAAHAFIRQHRPGWAALARAAAAEAAWAEVDRPAAPPEPGGAAAMNGTSAAGGAIAAGGATASGGANAAGGAKAAGGTSAATPSGIVAAGGRGERLEKALFAAQRALRALEAVGWDVEALDARLIAGRAALALGRPRLAQRQLELAAAGRDRGPVQVRTRAWHAAALVRLAQDDRRGASAAVAAGLRALEAHRMTLGATELRAHASGHGEELATLGLRLAIESGSAARVLAAAERRRAAGLLLRPARPPDDEKLAHELQELRRVSAALDASLREGRPDPDLLRRQAALERSVRRRALRARGENGAAAHDGDARDADDEAAAHDGDTRADDEAAAHGDDGATRPGGDARAAGDDRSPSVAAIADVLGARALVEFVALAGTLFAVTVVDGRARLHVLGAEAQIEREVGSLRFTLRKLATARPGSRTAEGMAQVAQTVAERLDALLLRPLRLAEERPLVIVPTGQLHALPWSMLPGLTNTPVAVAPSLRLWLRAATRPVPANPTQVFVAGPRLPAATEEVETLAHRHPAATTLTHDQATVANVAHALDGADHVHVAAHGRFRDDNPLFCSLELADGNVTVYDLERLNRVPQRIVLSSCESGLSAIHAGDELMGFTAALFALGTCTLIAATVPVPDEATKGLMLALDEALSNGEQPATALVNARRSHPKMSAAAAAFVCFGAG